LLFSIAAASVRRDRGNADTLLSVLLAAQEESRLLGTIENSLGIKEWLESEGHE
jgi:hypothetical protein